MDFLDSILFPDNTSADVRRLEGGRGYGMPSAGSDMGIYASQASEDERQAGLSGAASGLGSLVQLLTYMHKMKSGQPGMPGSPAGMPTGPGNANMGDFTGGAPGSAIPSPRMSGMPESTFGHNQQMPAFYQSPEMNKIQIAQLKNKKKDSDKVHALQLALLAMKSHSRYAGG